ncbi:transmembrane 53 [Pelobates cultripes]|uniref:Transmembrane 53 n=1 Tax=Pelobates cultripes TaxID=61616 RepID=A0AAD1SRW2_PELCU|nr:transmembrane 53 [Pelobates cultripes]
MENFESGDKTSQRQEPVVILLGWGGCKDRLLAKYSTIYHKQGCFVIRYTAAWRTVFISESFGFSTLREQAEKLLKLLFDYKLEKCPVMFHVFSNGGFMLYRYILELLHSHRQLSKLHVVGTIFDSAPGNRNVRGSVRALNVILKPNTNVLLRFLGLAAFCLMVIVVRIILYPLTRLLHENHYDAMKKDTSPWPQLYLYSKADPIISYLDVESMIALRRSRQLPTKAFDFEKSEHVEHYRRYPERYSEICTSFLKDCLVEAKGSSVHD